jgi:hypothetical protein
MPDTALLESTRKDGRRKGQRTARDLNTNQIKALKAGTRVAENLWIQMTPRGSKSRDASSARNRAAGQDATQMSLDISCSRTISYAVRITRQCGESPERISESPKRSVRYSAVMPD